MAESGPCHMQGASGAFLSAGALCQCLGVLPSFLLNLHKTGCRSTLKGFQPALVRGAGVAYLNCWLHIPLMTWARVWMCHAIWSSRVLPGEDACAMGLFACHAHSTCSPWTRLLEKNLTVLPPAFVQIFSLELHAMCSDSCPTVLDDWTPSRPCGVGGKEDLNFMEPSLHDSWETLTVTENQI